METAKKERPRRIIDVLKPEHTAAWKAARIAALKDDKTLSEWIFDALLEKLRRDKRGN